MISIAIHPEKLAAGHTMPSKPIPRIIISLFIMLLAVPGCKPTNSEGDPKTADQESDRSRQAVVFFQAAVSDPTKRLANALGTADDIAEVKIRVLKTGDSSEVLPETELAETPVGSSIWSGTLDNLPIEIALDFIGRAYNSAGEAIFTGQATHTLTSGGNSITLKLAAVDDGTEPTNPKILSAAMPAEVEVGSTDNPIYFNIQHTGEVTYEITVATGTLSTESSGIHDPNNGSLAARYNAPASTGTDYITLSVYDDDSDRVTTAFPIDIVDIVRASQVTVLIGPVLKSLHFQRITDSLIVEALTDPATGLDLTWSGTDDFGDLDSGSNPVVIASYEDSWSGTITTTATNDQTISASLTRTIEENNFLIDTKSLPFIRETSIAQEIEVGSTGNLITFYVGYPRKVDFSITVTGGGVDPETGEHDPATGRLSVTYDAPNESGTYSITLTVFESGTEETVSKTFPLVVINATGS
jgi:hypothetical protein